MTESTYAVIGAGPSGLAAARNLDRRGLPWVGYELSTGVGGLWDIDAPRSTVYESAHLISSRTTTEFTEFPMPAGTPDYPSHRDLAAYFGAFADEFDLTSRFRFSTEVLDVRRDGAAWAVTVRDGEGTRTELHAGVLVANGTLSEPNVPTFTGQETFTGAVIHTSAYKRGSQLAGQRVLIIGAGNSGCDIAVDAVHHAAAVDLSVRRGYHFVPKYVLGKPADTLNQGKPLPPRIKQFIDTRVLKLFTGDPVRFGFPAPDHAIYESHPIVNSLVLHHLGHGDLAVRPDIDRFDGDDVVFADGTRTAYDLVVLATGYRLHYPFVEDALLGWTGAGSGTSPDLYLNVFARGEQARGLFVLGMVEASGIGWQGRYEQAELVAGYLAALAAGDDVTAFEHRIDESHPDLSGGYKYLGLERMSYYVNKDAYRGAVRREAEELGDAS
ncbi:MAG: monooxygenase [Marmoricola sp.]|nr:monooxygenase [Marmoricola sp.]